MMPLRDTLGRLLKPDAVLPRRRKRQPIRRLKIGRNEPCPCGSGKKFKKCCGKVGAL